MLLAGTVSGTLYASGFWDDDAVVSITPARPQPEKLLTGGEAAAKANAEMLNSLTRRDLSITCRPDDHNTQTRDWIVVCTVAGPQSVIEAWFRVDDRTGYVEFIQ